MNNKNIPIAILYCILSVLSIPFLILLIVHIFLFGNVYHKICFLILGISIFLYALFNTLSHWIVINSNTPKSLKKVALLSSSLLISSILLCYSFSTLSGVSKWIMFGLVSLFFMYNELFFSIWTNIPFFLAEIFKDTNYIIFIIFLPNIIHFFIEKNLTLLFVLSTIASIILIIISSVFKYIYAKKKTLYLYTISKVLILCSLIIQVLNLLYTIPR